MKKFLNFIRNFQLFQSLKLRVILLIGANMILIIAAMIIYAAFSARQTAIENAKHSAQAVAKEYSNHIKITLEKPLVVGRTLVQAIESNKAVPERSRRDAYSAMIRTSLIENPDFLAIWLACEPNAIDRLDSIHANKDLGLKGLYISSFYREKDEIKYEEATANEEEELSYVDFYVIPKKRQKETILSPYFYSYTNSNFDKILETSMIVPIMDKNKFLGVVGIDVNLDFYQKMLEKIKPFEAGYVFLIDYDAIFVTNPNKNLIGKDLDKVYLELNDSLKIEEKIRRGESFSFLADIGDENKESYVAFSPISIGNTQTPWALAVVVPFEKITEKADDIFYTLLIMGGIGMLTLLLVVWFAARQIAIPLKQTTDVLQDLSKGIFDKIELHRIDKKAGREIADMADSLDSLIIGLHRVTDFATQIGKGNFNAEFSPLSQNDILGKSLIEMRQNLLNAKNIEIKRKEEEEYISWVTEGVAKFSEIIRKNSQNIQILADNVISNLISYLKADVGGIFLYNEENPDEKFLETISCFAYDRRKFFQKKILLGEGIVGACALERRAIVMTHLPPNYIEISSGLGRATPNGLLVVPMILDSELLGVIEIASLHQISKKEIELVEKIAESTATSFLSLKISEHTTELLQKSQIQAKELEQKEIEMLQQMENIEKMYEENAQREIETKSLIFGLNSTSFVAEFDMLGNVIDINENFLSLLNKQKDNVLGKNYYDLGIVEDEDTDSQHLWNELRLGNVQRCQHHFSQYESEFWILSTFFPILDKNEHPFKILIISQNISEAKKFEKEVLTFASKENEKNKFLETQESEMRILWAESLRIKQELENKDEEINKLKEEKISEQNVITGLKHKLLEAESELQKLKKI